MGDDGRRDNDVPWDPITIVIGDQNNVTAGHNNGSMTTGTYDPVDSYRDDMFLARPGVEAETFVGRESLFKNIDDFIATYPCGYFLITAKAGLGKTAFVMELSRMRGYYRHIVEPSDTALIVRKHLAARLIDRWGLDGVTDGAAFPASAGRTSWFGSVLEAAARKRDLEARGEPIVLVIDGLDEMRAADAERRMGLPEQLPDNVYILVTCRDGSPLIDQWGSVRGASIIADSDENLWDMRRLLEHAVGRPALDRAITEAGLEHEKVIKTLLDKCDGVWIYLRFVLSDIDSGRRPLHSLHELPDNLWDYYASNMERWRRDTDFWHHVGLPVLAALAAGGSEMTADMIAAVTGAGPLSQVEAFLNGPLQAFCHAERLPGGDRYRLYHGSVRQFLTGRLDHTYRVAGDWRHSTATDNSPLRHELRNGVRQAHTDFIAYFARRWGPIRAGLPDLADRPRHDTHDAYGLQHLVWHLQQTSQFDDIHLLLSGRGLHDAALRDPYLAAVWLKAHQRAGTTDSYTEHLKWALQDAVHLMTRPGRFSTPAATLAIRYAILSASLNSIAATVTPAIVAALVLVRIWSFRNALAHARKIADPMDRAEACLRLVHIGEGADREIAVKAAFDALMLARDDAPRCMALLDIAPFLPPHLIAAAISAACQIAVPGHRVGVLVRLLSALPEPTRTEAAVKLFREANNSYALGRMMDLMIAAAPFLPLELARVAAYRMYAVGRRHPLGPTIMAVALAPRLGPANHDAIGNETVLSVCAVKHTDLAAHLLGQVIPFLSPSAVAHIPAQASRLRQADEWRHVLGRLAAHAGDCGPTVLPLFLDRPGSVEWQRAMDAFAPGLDRRHIDDLAAVARTGPPGSRVSAILALVPYLSADQRSRLAQLDPRYSKMEGVLLQGVARMADDSTIVEQHLRAAFDDATSIQDRREVDAAVRTLTDIADAPDARRATLTDPGRALERLTDRMAVTNRPDALHVLLGDPALLFNALGDNGLGIIRRDVREVCGLLA